MADVTRHAASRDVQELRVMTLVTGSLSCMYGRVLQPRSRVGCARWWAAAGVGDPIGMRRTRMSCQAVEPFSVRGEEGFSWVDMSWILLGLVVIGG